MMESHKEADKTSKGASVGGYASQTDGSTTGEQKFDFLNWLYWNLWWQQYSYWNTIHQHSFSQEWNQNQPAGSGMGVQPPPSIPQPVNMDAGMNPFMRLRPPQAIRTRVISGYETCMAPLWRRGLAELIDTILVGLVLKFCMPNVDYRVPEMIFEGPDMWDDMTQEDFNDAKDTLMLFVYSTLLHRLLHIIFEALFLCVFMCTPGKYLMRLQLWKCTSAPVLTRTYPGYSIKVEPAGSISFLASLLRCLFKSTVSLVIPLVIFFFNLDRGRTLYDKLFGCVVVDVHSLNKPLYSYIQTRNENR